MEQSEQLQLHATSVRGAEKVKRTREQWQPPLWVTAGALTMCSLLLLLGAPPAANCADEPRASEVERSEAKQLILTPGEAIA